jgi:hypothetical protein
MKSIPQPPDSRNKQQKQRRFQACKNNCGTMITFDARLGRTPTGGWISMQEDVLGQLVKHDCPLKQKKKQSAPQAQQQQKPVITGSAATGAATAATSGLERKLDALIAEVQALRMELQSKK